MSSEPGIKLALLITPLMNTFIRADCSLRAATGDGHKYRFMTRAGLVTNENDHMRRTVEQCVKAVWLNESVKVFLSLNVSSGETLLQFQSVFFYIVDE